MSSREFDPNRPPHRGLGAMIHPMIGWAMLALVATPGEGLPSVSAALEPGGKAEVAIAAPVRPRDLTVLVSLAQPGGLPAGVPFRATVRFGDSSRVKALHTGDPDVVWTVRQPAGVEGRVALEAGPGITGPLPYAVRVAELGEAAVDGVAFEAEDNDSPDRANPLRLGQ